jgi:hypothetical protein
MNMIQNKVGIISTILLTILNGLAGFGVVLPTGFDAQGVALANAAALAVGALFVHLMGKDAAPVDPAA